MRRLKFFLCWGPVLGILIPGAGLVMALVMALCLGGGEASLREEEKMAPLPLPKAQRETTRMTRIAGELDFVPLVEVLAGNDVDLKRGAIEQLVRLKTPEAIHILLEHRSDHSLEVRYYVNAGLARIKDEFDEELDAARKQMQMDTYKNSARVFLARIYLQYARSGLLDAELARNYEDEALFHLTFVIESATPLAEAFRELIVTYLGRRDWELVEAVLQRARETQMLSASDAGRYQVWLCYATRRYTEIPRLMQDLQSAGALPPAWQTAVLWWGGM